MKLRSVVFSAAALGLAATGSLLGVAASSASATPPPPPVHHTLTYTALQTSAIHLGPSVTVIRDNEYQPSPTAPGYAETATLLEVCVAVPHINPPVATTVLAECNWRLTTTGAPPRSSLAGRSALDGLGQVGRVINGTGPLWNHAFSLLPHETTFVNLAPRTAVDTFNFFTPGV